MIFKRNRLQNRKAKVSQPFLTEIVASHPGDGPMWSRVCDGTFSCYTVSQSSGKLDCMTAVSMLLCRLLSLPPSAL